MSAHSLIIDVEMQATDQPQPPSTPAPQTGNRRAAPLPADERRAALIAATASLIRAHGFRVSTRQIAEAAGVAEGTIFRVFETKDALIEAAIASAFDPEPLLRRLADVDRSLPLRPRLEQVVGILQRRLQGVFHLLNALGMTGPPRTGSGPKTRERANAAVLALVTDIIGPDRDQFEVPVDEVVRLLRLLTFSGSHLQISEGRLLAPETIVGVVLDGVRRPSPGAGRTSETELASSTRTNPRATGV
ncbi:MAG: TetR/AcrR family transcriptional regulator [Nocardioidaceae bacterium]